MKQNQLIKQAFENVNRADFVAARYCSQVDIDAPLPIGYSQTISQPTTVKMMLEWLDTKPGEKVLDVGSGSGWTTALLSDIVGSNGKVYAVERVPELKKFGEQNCQKVGLQNVKFYLAEKDILGLPTYAPYDKILVSASADNLPQELVEQLKIGGKIVIPIGNSIFEISKKSAKDIETIEHYGFVFVPLIK